MKRSLLASTLAFVVACAHSGSAPPATTGASVPPTPAAVADAASASNAFASDLHAKLGAKSGNLFYSPASIALAVAMAREGARGTTASEIDAVLHLGGKPAGTMGALRAITNGSGDGVTAPEVRVANRLWVDRGMTLDPSFAARTASDYGASAIDVDFVGSPEPARRTINDWVAGETKDKIKDLLPEGAITTDTRLAITNAVYFKGSWKHPFDPKATAATPFFTSSSASHPVPMMFESAEIRSGEHDGAQVFELPYAKPEGRSGMSMIVILPKDRAGLPAVESAVAARGFAPFIGALGTTTESDVWLPKLKLTATFDLGETLGAMGMPTAFGDDADFSGIARTAGLRITRVIHKAFVETDEKGTEAAAATAVVVGIESVRVTPSFRADHPFLFVIRDDASGAIVFVGRVTDPG